SRQESKETRSPLAQSRDRYSPYMKELETGRFMNGIRVVRTLILDRIKCPPTPLNQCPELRKTKLVAARNRTSDLPDSGRPYEPKGYNDSPTSKTKVSYKTKAKMMVFKRLDIKYELKEKPPEMQLSQSKFYSLCPKNYRKPQKRTDVCNICAAREKIKKYSMAKGIENANLEQIMQLRVATEGFQVCKNLALEKRRNFKDQIAGLSVKSIIIIADFKENFKIGGGPIETTRDFYQKSQISDLCFCVLSKSGDQTQR
ncbi:hypothetical protein BB560_003445, partial [Smittium megazygosporum]